MRTILETFGIPAVMGTVLVTDWEFWLLRDDLVTDWGLSLP